MKHTKLQRHLILEIIRSEMASLRTYTFEYPYGDPSITVVDKLGPRRELAYDYIEKFAHKVFDRVESNVHENDKLRILRHMIRRLRKWELEKYYTEWGRNEAFAKGTDEYVNALDDVMALTKKLMQDHDVKQYYQTSACLICRIPFEEGDKTEFSNRGLKHVEDRCPVFVKKVASLEIEKSNYDEKEFISSN